jgi:hypothetical protein
MSFKNLKRSGAGADIQTLTKQMEAVTPSAKNYKDDRYWRPVVDKSNNGSAIIRFLPGIAIVGADDEYEPPFVRKWSHGFKGPTGLWYIENNRNTLDDQKDPCTDYNSMLWNSGDPENVAQAKRQKRKLGYISNIYVVKHPANPEDEGKVFLYEYGKKVYDKINEKVFPPADEDDIEPIPVFDFWKGANFRLRIKDVEGYRNYDSSSFDAPKPLFDDDAKLEEIFNQEHSLLAEVAPDKFKSYDELKKRLNEVLGIKDDYVDEEEPKRSEPKVQKSSEPKRAAVPENDMDDDVPFDADPPKSSGANDPKTFFAKLKKNQGAS